MTAAPVLKPCPFCGTTEMLRLVGATDGGWSFVRCHCCDAEGPDPDNLPGHWNTRAALDREAALMAERDAAHAEAQEQARLNGRGAERELARLDEAQTEVGRLRAFRDAAYDLAGKRPSVGEREPEWNADLFEVERRALANQGPGQ